MTPGKSCIHSDQHPSKNVCNPKNILYAGVLHMPKMLVLKILSQWEILPQKTIISQLPWMKLNLSIPQGDLQLLA